MSAIFDAESGFFFTPGKTDPATMALLEANFDEVARYQEYAIQRQVDSDARYTYFMRRLAAIRTLTFPLDFVATFFLLGKKYAMKRWALQKVLWAYLRGAATKAELAEALQVSI